MLQQVHNNRHIYSCRPGVGVSSSKSASRFTGSALGWFLVGGSTTANNVLQSWRWSLKLSRTACALSQHARGRAPTDVACADAVEDADLLQGRQHLVPARSELELSHATVGGTAGPQLTAAVLEQMTKLVSVCQTST